VVEEVKNEKGQGELSGETQRGRRQSTLPVVRAGGQSQPHGKRKGLGWGDRTPHRFQRGQRGQNSKEHESANDQKQGEHWSSLMIDQQKRRTPIEDT